MKFENKAKVSVILSRVVFIHHFKGMLWIILKRKHFALTGLIHSSHCLCCCCICFSFSCLKIKTFLIIYRHDYKEFLFFYQQNPKSFTSWLFFILISVFRLLHIIFLDADGTSTFFVFIFNKITIFWETKYLL